MVGRAGRRYLVGPKQFCISVIATQKDHRNNVTYPCLSVQWVPIRGRSLAVAVVALPAYNTILKSSSMESSVLKRDVITRQQHKICQPSSNQLCRSVNASRSFSTPRKDQFDSLP